MPFDSLSTKKEALKGIRNYSKSALADELRGLKGGEESQAEELAETEAGAEEVLEEPKAIEVEKVSVSGGEPENDVAEGVEDPEAAAAFAGEDVPAVGSGALGEAVEPSLDSELDISTLSPEIIKQLLGE